MILVCCMSASCISFLIFHNYRNEELSYGMKDCGLIACKMSCCMTCRVSVSSHWIEFLHKHIKLSHSGILL